MIIKKSTLLSLVKEEVVRQEKKIFLQKRINEIQQEIKNIDESSFLGEDYNVGFGAPNTNVLPRQVQNGPPQGAGTPEQQAATQELSDKDKMSFYKPKLGQTVVLNFEGPMTIKMQRQSDDFYKVVDASQSTKLQNGDLVKVSRANGEKGEHAWIKGKKYDFHFQNRKSQRYETKPVLSWELIQ